MDEALELVESCYPRRLAAAELLNPSEAASMFDRDVLSASTFLPPGFTVPQQANMSLASIKVCVYLLRKVSIFSYFEQKLRIMLMLQQMRSKVCSPWVVFFTPLLMDFYMQELWREAFAFTDDICKGLKKSALRKDSLQINPDIVRDTVVMVMRHHLLSGLTMGCKVKGEKILVILFHHLGSRFCVL